MVARFKGNMGIAFVIKSSENIAGYFCVDFSGEESYKEIAGEWKSNEDFAVVHR